MGIAPLMFEVQPPNFAELDNAKDNGISIIFEWYYSIIFGYLSYLQICKKSKKPSFVV